MTHEQSEHRVSMKGGVRNVKIQYVRVKFGIYIYTYIHEIVHELWICFQNIFTYILVKEYE